MDLKSASSILFRVRDDPAVKTARAQVESAKQEVDKIDLSLEGDFNTKRANFPALVDDSWEDIRHGPAGQYIGMGCLVAIVGGGIATGVLAGMIPMLVPFKGLITLGAIVAGFKWGLKGLGKHVIQPVIRKRVNKQVNEQLEGMKVRAQGRLATCETAYQQTVKRVTDDLSKQAAQTAATQYQAGTVTVDDEQVKIGAIVVPRRSDAE